MKASVGGAGAGVLVEARLGDGGRRLERDRPGRVVGGIAPVAVGSARGGVGRLLVSVDGAGGWAALCASMVRTTCAVPSASTTMARPIRIGRRLRSRKLCPAASAVACVASA